MVIFKAIISSIAAFISPRRVNFYCGPHLSVLFVLVPLADALLLLSLFYMGVLLETQMGSEHLQEGESLILFILGSD